MTEQRHFALIQFDFAGKIRTADSSDVLACQFQNFRVIDEDLTDVRAQVITERADDNITFLMDQEWCRAAFSNFFDGFPVLDTVLEIPAQGIGRFTHTGGADNQTHSIRDIQGRQGFFQLGAVIPFDTAGDPPGTRVIRHQNQIAAGQADKSGECRAFITALFFVHLNNDFLTFSQDIFDIRAAGSVVISREILAGNFFDGKETVTLCAIVNKSSF